MALAAQNNHSGKENQAAIYEYNKYKKLRSYVTNIYSKSNLRIEVFRNIIRQYYKHSGKKKKMKKIEKNNTNNSYKKQ